MKWSVEMQGFSISIHELDTGDTSWMFESEWNYKLKDFQPRTDILQFIEVDHDKEDEMTILEIGCGYGKTLEFLSKNCPNANLHAIEIDKIMADYLEKACPDVVVLNRDI